MNIPHDKEQLRLVLLDKVLECVQGQISHIELLQFAQTFECKLETHNDIPLRQSLCILDFLGTQISNGNSDLLNRQLVEEGYVYIMNKLTNAPEVFIP